MTNTEITTKEIKIPSHDGSAFMAYVAMPEDASAENPYPAILMIQEIFGVNSEMRKKCDEHAAQGYIAICPDLFWRMQRNVQLNDNDEQQLERAFKLFGEFAFDLGIEDLNTTVGYARNMTECNEKIGSIGYCLGGHLSYRLAASEDLDAAVSYYGVNIHAYIGEMKAIQKPILFHIASKDEFVDKDAQKIITSEASKYDHVITDIYEGQDHAFTRYGGAHYNEQAANLANTRTSEFLKRYLK
ncbi:MAG: dienelactone hydrolase family protein [Bdellovibrionales bacterium]